MHHALRITEILDTTLRYTDRGADAACVRVCRIWHEPALDALWHYLTRLDALFDILGPMWHTHQGLYAFAQPHISLERWDRFSFYGNRVRRLQYDGFTRIHPQSLATLSISRPFLHILPNLTHLTWRQDLNEPAAALMLSLIFMSPSLTNLTVTIASSIYQEGLVSIGNFFRDIALRSPHMQHLGLLLDSPNSPVLALMLSKSISAFHELKTVLLSEVFHTTDMLKTLSTFPHLEAIRLPSYSFSSPFEGGDNYSLPILPTGAFSNIREIHMQASLTSMIRFLQPPFPATCLRQLAISSAWVENYSTIGLFFESVGSACANIDTLLFKVHAMDFEEISNPLPFSCLEPLLACKSLISLSLDMPIFLDLDDTHAALMASSWPRLQRLHLNPHPWTHFSHDIRLTFGVLNILAKGCPDIQYLGVYVQPTLPMEPWNPLPKLQHLVLGSNAYSYSVEDIAFFLTLVTPPTCEFNVEPITHHLILSYYRERLKKVFSLVSIMRKVDEQYRERLNALEEEVQRIALTVAPLP